MDDRVASGGILIEIDVKFNKVGGVENLTVSVKRIIRSCGSCAMLVIPKDESKFSERRNSLDDTVISTTALDS